jgi:hypothetical protein
MEYKVFRHSRGYDRTIIILSIMVCIMSPATFFFVPKWGMWHQSIITKIGFYYSLTLPVWFAVLFWEKTIVYEDRIERSFWGIPFISATIRWDEIIEIGEEFQRDPFNAVQVRRYDKLHWYVIIKSKNKRIRYNSRSCGNAKELTLLLAEKVPAHREFLTQIAEGWKD